MNPNISIILIINLLYNNVGNADELKMKNN